MSPGQTDRLIKLYRQLLQVNVCIFTSSYGSRRVYKVLNHWAYLVFKQDSVEFCENFLFSMSVDDSHLWWGEEEL